MTSLMYRKLETKAIEKKTLLSLIPISVMYIK